MDFLLNSSDISYFFFFFDIIEMMTAATIPRAASANNTITQAKSGLLSPVCGFDPINTSEVSLAIIGDTRVNTAVIAENRKTCAILNNFFITFHSLHIVIH